MGDAEQRLIEGKDFYFDETGLMVLTRSYLLARGYCCQNGCRNCPYGVLNQNQAEPSEDEIDEKAKNKEAKKKT